MSLDLFILPLEKEKEKKKKEKKGDIFFLRREWMKEDSHLPGETEIRLLLSATVLPDRFEQRFVSRPDRDYAKNNLRISPIRIDAVVTILISCV